MAIIEAAAGSHKWSETAAWKGGAVPTAADDVVFVEASGTVELAAEGSCRSMEFLPAWTGEFKLNAKLNLGTTTENTAKRIWWWESATGKLTSGASGELVMVTTTTVAQKMLTGHKLIRKLVIKAGTTSKVEITDQSLFEFVTLEQGQIILTTKATEVKPSSWGVINVGSTELTRTFNPGTNVIQCTEWKCAKKTGLTISSGNYQLVCSGLFEGGAATYKNVLLTGDNVALTGNNTFTVLAICNPGAVTGIVFQEASVQTVSTLRTCGYAGKSARMQSSVAGKAFKIKSKTAKTRWKLRYIKLKDCTAEGTELSAYAGESENISGNTGWKFEDAPPIEVSAAGGLWSETTAWVGGIEPDDDDDILFTAASGSLKTKTTAGTSAVRSIKSEVGYTGTLEILGTKSTIVGGQKSPSGYTIDWKGGTMTGTFQLVSRSPSERLLKLGNQSVNIEFVAFTSNAIIWAYNSTEGEWKLAENTKIGSSINTNSIVLEAGTFNPSGFELEIGRFASAVNTVEDEKRKIKLETSTIKCSSWYAGLTTNISNLSVEAGTSEIIVVGSGEESTFQGASMTWYNLFMEGTKTGPFANTIQGNNTFHNLTLQRLPVGEAIYRFGTTQQTLTGTILVKGSGTEHIKIEGSPSEFKKASGPNVNLDFLFLEESNTDNKVLWFAGPNSLKLKGTDEFWQTVSEPRFAAKLEPAATVRVKVRTALASVLKLLGTIVPKKVEEEEKEFHQKLEATLKLIETLPRNTSHRLSSLLNSVTSIPTKTRYQLAAVLQSATSISASVRHQVESALKFSSSMSSKTVRQIEARIPLAGAIRSNVSHGLPAVLPLASSMTTKAIAQLKSILAPLGTGTFPQNIYHNLSGKLSPLGSLSPIATFISVMKALLAPSPSLPHVVRHPFEAILKFLTSLAPKEEGVMTKKLEAALAFTGSFRSFFITHLIQAKVSPSSVVPTRITSTLSAVLKPATNMQVHVTFKKLMEAALTFTGQLIPGREAIVQVLRATLAPAAKLGKNIFRPLAALLKLRGHVVTPEPPKPTRPVSTDLLVVPIYPQHFVVRGFYVDTKELKTPQVHAKIVFSKEA